MLQSHASTTASSVERLRDVPVRARNLPDISSLESRSGGYLPPRKVSSAHLGPIHESFSASMDLKECDYMHEYESSPKPGESRVPLEETNGTTVSAPCVDLTKGNTQNTSMMDGSSRDGGELNELKELFDRKTAEVESLSAVVLEKEELIYTLQDRIQDTEEQVDELTQQLAAAESQLTSRLEEAASRESQLSSQLQVAKSSLETVRSKLVESDTLRQDKENEYRTTKVDLKEREETLAAKEEELESCYARLDSSKEKVAELEQRLLQDAEPDLAGEMARLREENADRLEGIQNLHDMIKELVGTELRIDILFHAVKANHL